MTVSIVIPHWNRHELLLSLLDSIRQQKLPAGVELETLVVDNGSTDQSVEVATFKLVCVASQRREVADPIVAGTRFEKIAKRQRG